jgi:hypothetical protein
MAYNNLKLVDWLLCFVVGVCVCVCVCVCVAVLCKSNGKDTFSTFSGTTWARRAMCESALTVS